MDNPANELIKADHTREEVNEDTIALEDFSGQLAKVLNQILRSVELGSRAQFTLLDRENAKLEKMAAQWRTRCRNFGRKTSPRRG